MGNLDYVVFSDGFCGYLSANNIVQRDAHFCFWKLGVMYKVVPCKVDGCKFVHHFLKRQKNKMCVICLTPQLSVEAIPLFASEASNRVVAMRVRPAIAGSCAARTPEHRHQANLQKSWRGRRKSDSSISRHPRFASQLWNPAWHSQLKEPTELMQLV